MNPNVPAVGKLRIPYPWLRGAYRLDPACEECFEVFRGYTVRAGVRRLGDQLGIGWVSRSLLFGDVPIGPHLLIQELSVEIRIEQQYAVGHIVEGVAQHFQFV